MGLSCRRSRRQIREIFVHGSLPPEPLRRLWRHLHACEDCRARYDRALRLERVVATGGLQLPSAMELDLLVPLLTAPVEEPTKSPFYRLFAPRLLVPALSLCVVLVIGAVAVWQLRPPAQETWLVRSIGSATLAVRAFCETRAVVGGEPDIRSLSVDPGPQEAVSCPQTGALLFAIMSDEVGHLYVAHWTRGRPEWLLPDAAGQQPLPVEVSTELGPLPVRVGPDLIDSLEHITISFVRVPAPVSTDEVEAWLDAWHDGEIFDLPPGVAIVERRVPIESAREEGEP